jgi:Cu/Ag efflux protein CusF
MNKTPRTRLVALIGAALSVLLLLPAAHAQQGGKKEYVFRGKVEKVDTKAKTLIVNGENVQGWMAAMTMTYGVDKEDVVNHVKAGDQITAKVHEGDFKTLYDVQVVPPKSGEAKK